MSSTAFPQGDSAWTPTQVEVLLRAVEDMFHRRDIEALVSGFTEDCVFRFAEQPEQRGHAALRALFAARFARQHDYRLHKTNLAIQDNCLANKWEGTWTDSASGRAMAGFGVEVWVMHGGRIAVWDAGFNAWAADGDRKSAVM